MHENARASARNAHAPPDGRAGRIGGGGSADLADGFCGGGDVGGREVDHGEVCAHRAHDVHPDGYS